MRTSFFVYTLLVTSAALLVGSSRAAEPAESLRERTRAALQESVRISKDNREVVVHRLVDVYDELSRTQKPADDDRNRLQLQVRARLDRLAGIIARQVAAEAIAGQAVPDNSPNHPKPAAGIKQPRSVKPQDEVLAQRIVAPGRPAPPGPFPRGRFRAGAAFGGGMGNAFAAQPPDNGQALVDLIQRTIEPSSWDIVGGPGSIVYFRPMRVLVVRNRSEVHEQLQDVVRQLRP